MNRVAEDILMHYGTKRHSGRYPWGSGDDPFQRSGDFLSRVNEYKKLGYSERDIAKAVNLYTTDLRLAIKEASYQRRSLLSDRARSLREDGKSLNEIAQIMGYKNDSSIRSLLNEKTAENKNLPHNTADKLKEVMQTKRMIDVGDGVEKEMGVSGTVLAESLYILQDEGYNVYNARIPQVTNPGMKTTVKILAAPDISYGYAYNHVSEVEPWKEYHSTDGGLTWNKLKYPASIGSDRVSIRYGDQGGLSKDGVIEIRRGVEDLDLGKSHYAQVRILVDGTHYLKGMAMYSDNMPEGADIVFNTNKTSDVPKMKVLKGIKEDPDNPFGALIKACGQSEYDASDGTKKLSAINKLKEEGDWDVMSRNLSSQFLSKQPMKLIETQLKLTYADKQAEFEEICSYTNPTVKKKLLMDFADGCDSDAIHLKASALPRQKTQVILPIDELKADEVYARNYRNGEKVVLVRYPHAGTFEIPELRVNNKNKAAIDILGNATDAIGINSKVAERLSGADFDGDTVIVIPINENVQVKTTHALEGLRNFEPKVLYKIPDGDTTTKRMTKDETQKQMGMVSNLITDMTLKGAIESEIVRAVKHSMVVIDAEKHGLDYKRSERENGIAELKNLYQKHYNDDGEELSGHGASTLLSMRKQDVRVPERIGSPQIDPETGKVTYKESGRFHPEFNKRTGKYTDKMIPNTDTVSLMSITEDARTLSSGTPQENAYADYANKLKALANASRKEYKAVHEIKSDSQAKKVYSQEVDHLLSQLNVALMNAPRERAAQRLANIEVNAKKQDNPKMDKKDLKKAKQLAITKARITVGASGKDSRIDISDREWEAIQAGAVSPTALSKILRYSDPDKIRQRAMPKATTELSPAKQAKINCMRMSGYSNAEIADALGVSTSTVFKYATE